MYGQNHWIIGFLQSTTQSEHLPSNLVVAFDYSHNPSDDAVMHRAINLKNNLSSVGSVFNTIEGPFTIPDDTNVLLIPNSNTSYTTAELNVINDWFTSEGARLLWVAGDSDYAGAFVPQVNNEILAKIGANLRISADSVGDSEYNDGAFYRVAVQTPVSDGKLNSILTEDVSSVIMHGSCSVLGYQNNAIVDLTQNSITDVEVIMKTSIEAYSLDLDSSVGEFDYYSSNQINDSYPMMAIQNKGNQKYVIVSGEVIFSDYRRMYDLFTHSGFWNGGIHDGKTLVDNVLAWFGREVGEASPISIFYFYERIVLFLVIVVLITIILYFCYQVYSNL